MIMKIISKHFTSLRAAERYQTRLCNRYDKVCLISAPRFNEDGIYIWQVGGHQDD